MLSNFDGTAHSVTQPGPTTSAVDCSTSEPVVVVGLLAHNEEATVEASLRSILCQEVTSFALKTVVVVASGCTDRTEAIVRKISDEDARVRLVVEPRRSGKAAAINLLLAQTAEPIVVVTGGDVVFCPGSLDRLVSPLQDSSIGMTGARPVPTNPRVGFVNRAIHVIWDLHHQLSLRHPKMGEAVAFRRVPSVDRGTLVDEAFLESMVRSKGLRLRYVHDAVVRNRGPETLRDLVRQRQRVHRGHLELASSRGYSVASMNSRYAIEAMWHLRRQGEPVAFLLATAAIEAFARLLAHISRHGPSRNGIWTPIVSSKQVIQPGHVLRAHFEAQEHVRLRGPESEQGFLARRKLVSAVRAMIRAEDKICWEGEELIVSFRGDLDSARCIATRLRRVVDVAGNPIAWPPELQTTDAPVGL